MQQLLAAKAHIGSKNGNHQSTQYVYKRRPDGMSKLAPLDANDGKESTLSTSRNLGKR
jgi:hypothetical protein